MRLSKIGIINFITIKSAGAQRSAGLHLLCFLLNF